MARKGRPAVPTDARVGARTGSSSWVPTHSQEHVLADVHGTWEPATVQRRLLRLGWGADVGYPGIVLADDGSTVQGMLLSSTNLSDHWDRLDEFEGAGYDRVPTSVTLGSGATVSAQLYVLSDRGQSVSERPDVEH